MSRLMKSFRIVAVAAAVYALRDDVDEQLLDPMENDPLPASFVELSGKAAGRSSSTRSGKGRHHAAPQVHHSAHRRHARKEYQDEESDDGASEDRIASLPEDKDSAAEGQDDEPEPDVSRREDSRYDGDQEVETQDRHSHHTRHVRSREPKEEVPSDSPSDSRKPMVHNTSHQPSPPVESNQTVHDRAGEAAGGQPPPAGLPHEAVRTGWLVTSSCWAILTLVAAAIALWLKRPELAEKGMCFVTRRISKMAWEPELQRKEVAVQAGEPCNDRPQDAQKET